jgi:hypothetical protein
MVRLRGMHAARRESFAWKMWMRAFRSRRIYSLGTWMATRFRFLAPKSLRPARRTLHELARRGGVPDV